MFRCIRFLSHFPVKGRDSLSLTLVSSKVMGQTLRADGERINRWLGIEEF